MIEDSRNPASSGVVESTRAVQVDDAVLKYAPPAAARRMPALVLASGLITTVVTLVALHFVQAYVKHDIMSFTVRLVIPLGALGVGLLAGIGYGLAAYFLNVRVQRWLIWTMVMLQVWAFFAGHFIEFKSLGPLFDKETGARVGFVRYFHSRTTHMVWVRGRSSNSTPPPMMRSRGQGVPAEEELDYLGNTGYFFRALAVFGFVMGGIAIPLAQRRIPYCPLCQRYMKTKTLLKLPATAKLPAIKLRGKFQLDTPEHIERIEHALGVMQRATIAINAGQADDLRALIAQEKEKVSGRVPAFAVLELAYCRQCLQGTYTASLKNNGNYQTGLARQLARADVNPDTVASILQAPGRPTLQPAA